MRSSLITRDASSGNTPELRISELHRSSTSSTRRICRFSFVDSPLTALPFFALGITGEVDDLLAHAMSDKSGSKNV